MFYTATIVICIAIQLIYISGTDIPFYYKEIVYDWNYTINKNERFDTTSNWIRLYTEKGYILDVEQLKETKTVIQTDLFSYQQNISIHEYLNSVLLLIITAVIMYVMYTSTNTILYKHERMRLNIITFVCLLTLIISFYTYNTELLTSILYKTSFTYTDNIYINNTNENNALWLYVITIILIMYYIRAIKTKQQQKLIRYNIYIITLLLNIINENTIIGIEYLYIIIYMEAIILIIHIISNLSYRTNGRVV